MRSFIAVAVLLIGTLTAACLLLWAFGEIGLLFVVIGGFTFPLWGHIALEMMGVDNE